jgi:hypothetical protein
MRFHLKKEPKQKQLRCASSGKHLPSKHKDLSTKKKKEKEERKEGGRGKEEKGRRIIKGPGGMAKACNLSYLGSKDRRLQFKASPSKKLVKPYLKKTS